MNRKDEKLIMKFSAFMKIVINHTKIDYIRKQTFQDREVSLEQVPETSLCYSQPLFQTKEYMYMFEKEGLSRAFEDLTKQKKRSIDFDNN